MTLSTNVYVLDEADPREVFDFCRELLNADDSVPFTDDESYIPGLRSLRNRAGSGLSALLWLTYRPDAPIRATVEEHGPYCEDDCDGSWHAPPHWLDVDFDTAYGYRDERGWGCGALHASLVAQLGEWLDERGLRWAWRNEFTGEVHIGDRYERLLDLFGEGEEAERWMREIILPVIKRAFGDPS